jgi:hypothetical protein
MDKLTRDTLVILLKEQQALSEFVAGLAKAQEMEPSAREALAVYAGNGIFQIAMAEGSPESKQLAASQFLTGIQQSGAPDDLRSKIAKIETLQEHRQAQVAAHLRVLEGLSFDD